MNQADRKFIEDDLARIKSEYDIATEHRFAMWVVGVLHFNWDFETTVLEEIYQRTQLLLDEPGAGDQCLDGFYYDEAGNTLYLYQTKWPGSAKKAQTAAHAREVATALHLLHQDIANEASLPEGRAAAVDSLRTVIEQNGSIILRGVTGGTWRPTHFDQAKKVIPKELADRTDVELLDVRDLAAMLAEKTQDLAGTRVEIRLLAKTQDPVLHHPAETVPGLGDAAVTLMSAISLGDVANEYKQRLFEKNVRLYLGRGRVNKDMEETLRDPVERQSFWYGHNGITILCDEYEFKGKSHRPTTVSLLNPQVVNGCQTATTLAQVLCEPGFREKVKDFAVLARIIRLTGVNEVRDSAAEMIAYRTNSQTAVNDADLRANDPHQRHYQNILQKYGQKWFYERKRGEWKDLKQSRKASSYKASKRADRCIQRDIYQQGWRSYSGRPSEAITKKNHVWVRGTDPKKDLYEEVFNLDRRACDIVLVSVLLDWFSQVFRVDRENNSLAFDIHKGLRKHASHIRRAKMLIAAHSVALFGSLVRSAYTALEKYPSRNIDAIIDSVNRGSWVSKRWAQRDWKVMEPIIRPIMKAWATYINMVVAGDETLYTSLKRPREQAFDELWDLLEGELEVAAKEIIDVRSS